VTKTTTLRWARLAPGCYEARIEGYREPGSPDWFDAAWRRRYEITDMVDHGRREWALTYPHCARPDDMYPTLREAKNAAARHNDRRTTTTTEN